MYTYIHTYIYKCIYVSVCVYIYICMYTYMTCVAVRSLGYSMTYLEVSGHVGCPHTNVRNRMYVNFPCGRNHICGTPMQSTWDGFWAMEGILGWLKIAFDDRTFAGVPILSSRLHVALYGAYIDSKALTC